MSNSTKLIEELGHLFRILKHAGVKILGLIGFIPATLLMVETIPLIVTLFVVQTSRKESKDRMHLIQEMYRTAKIVSREDYFNSVMNGYRTA